MAKRAKKGEAIITAGDPRKVFDDHWPAIKQAKADHEKAVEATRSASGVLRAAFKAYKKAGGDVHALTFAMAQRHRDPDEITREFSKINEALLWIGIPVGAQLGLFKDGETVGARVDGEKIAEQQGQQEAATPSAKALKKATADGKAAGVAGKTLDNPYEDGTPAALAYQGGWRDGQTELANRMMKSPGNGSAGIGETVGAA